MLEGVFILSKYGSASKFAKSINWDGSKVRRIIRGDQPPTALDIEEMANALGLDNPEEFTHVFFPNLSVKWMPNGDKRSN